MWARYLWTRAARGTLRGAPSEIEGEYGDRAKGCEEHCSVLPLARTACTMSRCRRLCVRSVGVGW
jgi:hypothetical protein